MERTKSFVSEKGILYLVATPIGNLKETSPRALEAFSSCDLIAAEDTRNTFSLLSKFNIKKELFSLREHNESEASEHIINLLKNNKTIVYVSDAGYPGISDPGNILAKKVIEAGLRVSTINGSCAFLNALVSSGLNTNHFYFYGFLSPKEGEAIKELENLRSREETLIFYEAPHRIDKTLGFLYKVFGNRYAVIGRELTKFNEEFIRGPLGDLMNIDPSSLKGEMVIIIEGNKEITQINDADLLNRIEHLKELGISEKIAIKVVSEEYNVNNNYLKKLIYKD